MTARWQMTIGNESRQINKANELVTFHLITVIVTFYPKETPS